MVAVLDFVSTAAPPKPTPAVAVSPVSTNNLVSWQTAFWAIIAALLNVLIQNGGAVCGFYPERVFLRSSPIICAIDSLLCIIKLIWMMTLGCSPTTAARHVWYDRFDDCDAHERETSGIDSMWRLSMVAFVLGALPQIIKIFAIQGVPFTQTLAAVLLTAFLVVEFLRIVAGTPHAKQLNPMPIVQQAKSRFNKAQKIISIMAIISQALFWIWSIGKLLPSSWFLENANRWEDKQYNTTVLSFFVFFCLVLITGWCLIFGLGCVIMGTTITVVDRLSGDTALARLYTRASNAFTDMDFKIIGCVSSAFALDWDAAEVVFIILFPFLFSVFVIVACGFSLTYFRQGLSTALDSAPMVSAFVARFVVAAILLSVILLITHTLYRLLFMGALSKHPRRMFGFKGSIREFCSLSFLVLNFVTLYIYYCSIYSSEGTYKPSWTDKFG